MRGRGSDNRAEQRMERSYGLTKTQIRQCIVCWYAYCLLPNSYLDKRLVAEELMIGDVHARKFIRQMCRAGILRGAERAAAAGGRRGGARYVYTPRWYGLVQRLRRAHRLPGRCEVPGCGAWAWMDRYRGHYLCRDHLMRAGCRWCPRAGTARCAQLRCCEAS